VRARRPRKGAACLGVYTARVAGGLDRGTCAGLRGAAGHAVDWLLGTQRMPPQGQCPTWCHAHGWIWPKWDT
jgi:hypothetical protein